MPVLTSQYVPPSFSMSAFLSFSSSLPRVPRDEAYVESSPGSTMPMMLASHAEYAAAATEVNLRPLAPQVSKQLSFSSAAYQRGRCRSRRRGFSHGTVEALSDQRVPAGDQARAPEPQHVNGSPFNRLWVLFDLRAPSSRLFATTSSGKCQTISFTAPPPRGPGPNPRAQRAARGSSAGVRGFCPEWCRPWCGWAPPAGRVEKVGLKKSGLEKRSLLARTTHSDGGSADFFRNHPCG